MGSGGGPGIRRWRSLNGGAADTLGRIVLLQTLILAVTGPPTSPEYLPLRVADAEGYFKREGLTVVLKTTRAEVGAAEALAQGQVDLAATSLEAILRFGPRQPRQMSKLVLGLTAAPPVALLTTRNLEGTLTSVKNLVGLRIGVATPDRKSTRLNSSHGSISYAVFCLKKKKKKKNNYNK